jgi:hypothetical protein
LLKNFLTAYVLFTDGWLELSGIVRQSVKYSQFFIKGGSKWGGYASRKYQDRDEGRELSNVRKEGEKRGLARQHAFTPSVVQLQAVRHVAES